MSGIFEVIETSVGKCLYVDDLAVFYSVKATAMIKLKMQGSVGTLVENANRTGFSFVANKDV